MEDWPTSVRTGNFLDLPALMSSLGFAGVSNTAYTFNVCVIKDCMTFKPGVGKISTAMAELEHCLQ